MFKVGDKVTIDAKKDSWRGGVIEYILLSGTTKVRFPSGRWAHFNQEVLIVAKDNPLDVFKEILLK